MARTAGATAPCLSSAVAYRLAPRGIWQEVQAGAPGEAPPSSPEECKQRQRLAAGQLQEWQQAEQLQQALERQQARELSTLQAALKQQLAALVSRQQRQQQQRHRQRRKEVGQMRGQLQRQQQQLLKTLKQQVPLPTPTHR